MEAKLDRMNAAFAELSTEYVKTQETIGALYQELGSQKTLAEEEKSEEKVSNCFIFYFKKQNYTFISLFNSISAIIRNQNKYSSYLRRN